MNTNTAFDLETEIAQAQQRRADKAARDAQQEQERQRQQEEFAINSLREALLLALPEVVQQQLGIKFAYLQPSPGETGYAIAQFSFLDASLTLEYKKHAPWQWLLTQKGISRLTENKVPLDQETLLEELLCYLGDLRDRNSGEAALQEVIQQAPLIEIDETKISDSLLGAIVRAGNQLMDALDQAPLSQLGAETASEIRTLELALEAAISDAVKPNSVISLPNFDPIP